MPVPLFTFKQASHPGLDAYLGAKMHVNTLQLVKIIPSFNVSRSRSFHIHNMTYSKALVHWPNPQERIQIHKQWIVNIQAHWYPSLIDFR